MRVICRWAARSVVFGGLSGHQGAFRSMFLLKSGLILQRFIATGVVLAVLVDVARMLVYGWSFSANTANVQWTMVLSACSRLCRCVSGRPIAA